MTTETKINELKVTKTITTKNGLELQVAINIFQEYQDGFSYKNRLAWVVNGFVRTKSSNWLKIDTISQDTFNSKALCELLNAPFNAKVACDFSEISEHKTKCSQNQSFDGNFSEDWGRISSL